jgi:uncharacterized membrane protein
MPVVGHTKVSSSVKRSILGVGIVLIGIFVVSYLAVALIATFEGSGSLPIAAVPLLVAIVSLAIHWLWRKIGNLLKE